MSRSVKSLDAETLIELRDLRVSFDGTPALHGVDLTVARGESVGMVGESGCGKSVTWLAALGLLPSKAVVAGHALLAGRNLIGAPGPELDMIRGGRVAMIFQDPASALNPVLRVGRQITEALALHRGLTGAAARAEAKRLLEVVGIPGAAQRLDAYPHEFSGGQNQRVMIAMALAGEPDLLIADEPTTALDATIQAQILDLIAEIRRAAGMALVLISHDLGVVAETCERICVMYAGRIVESAPAAALFTDPRHPYSRGLLDALPPLSGPRRRLDPIPGVVPEPRSPPPGCAFGPRCRAFEAACAEAAQDLRAIEAGRAVACRRVSAAPLARELAPA